MDTLAGLRNRSGQSRTAAAERVLLVSRSHLEAARSVDRVPANRFIREQGRLQ
jgi:hypothetical protein